MACLIRSMDDSLSWLICVPFEGKKGKTKSLDQVDCPGFLKASNLLGLWYLCHRRYFLDQFCFLCCGRIFYLKMFSNGDDD